MKILFISSEMNPLAATGGLGDVVGSLPRVLRQKGHDARVIMPLYRQIKRDYFEDLKFMRWAMIKLGWRTMYSGLFRLDLDGLPVYLIDNEFYFGHDNLYIDYSFDIERFSFFQRAVLEALGEEMEFEPDILHLNDWQTGMIPVVLEAHYKAKGFHENVNCVMTIHNLKYQGIHGREQILDLFDLPESYMSEAGILKDGVPNFLKTGIQFSNRVTTVSPNYAKEIMTDYYGEGLNGLLAAQGWKVSGILNGIDTDSYNPETDPEIPSNYGPQAWKRGKAACKKALQTELGLAVEAKTPLFVMVSRLVEQKGIDLLLHIVDELLEEDVQLAVLGTGNHEYERRLTEAAGRHPDKMRALITFDSKLARRMYSGGDLYLMPSLFEPCGLSQMISMRYGTLPIVRQTGGLADTVQAYNKFQNTGTGFGFLNINAHELLFTSKEAAGVYRNNPDAWNNMVFAAMNCDFSWDKSADEYIKLYKEIEKETSRI
ncbi:MAG: glycogen synthase [Eubacteriales bacterium]|nr:glycogen synthase [Eubacteriales bacterium]